MPRSDIARLLGLLYLVSREASTLISTSAVPFCASSSSECGLCFLHNLISVGRHLSAMSLVFYMASVFLCPVNFLAAD